MFNGIDYKDELNLYLVAKGIKPAGDLSMRGPADIEDAEPRIEDVAAIKSHLESNLPFHQKGYVETGTGKIYKAHFAHMPMGLEFALGADSHADQGLAYGYPKEDIKNFGKIINKELRNSAYGLVCMAKALQTGLELPLWLAYISFAPTQLDLVNNNVSKGALKQGEHFRSYIKRNNPQLADFVEKKFLENINPPDSWILLADKSYKLSWDNKK